MRWLALITFAACGRVGFDATLDAAPTFCATALPQVPGDAMSKLCMDFEGLALGALDDQQKLAGPQLYVRGTPGYETLAVVQDTITTNHAFRYAPAANAVCSAVDGCCYGDVFVDFGTAVYADRAHFEYDHYAIDTGGGWIGGMFWGALNYPYMTNFVTPAFELGRWQHVTIDGIVGAAQPLVITVDGIVRENNAGTNDLHAGINATVGQFCWNVAGSGYVDNVLFWAR